MVSLTKELVYIDIPDFKPEYCKETEYGYVGKPRENLEKLLREKSENHCMYCYALLKSDRAETGEVDHAIEKTLSDALWNCVPNLALLCHNCNASLKRVGERKRKTKAETVIEAFEKDLNCLNTKCKGECDNYSKLKEVYCEVGQIILQPMGVVSKTTDNKLCLQYDVFNAEFVASHRYNYDEKDLQYIENHIVQFRLNDTDFKTTALAEFIEDAINADGKYNKIRRRYSNYIVDLFIDILEKLPETEVMELCEELYTRYKVLHMF